MQHICTVNCLKMCPGLQAQQEAKSSEEDAGTDLESLEDTTSSAESDDGASALQQCLRGCLKKLHKGCMLEAEISTMKTRLAFARSQLEAAYKLQLEAQVSTSLMSVNSFLGKTGGNVFMC